jgi:hypothetical protein
MSEAFLEAILTAAVCGGVVLGPLALVGLLRRDPGLARGTGAVLALWLLDITAVFLPTALGVRGMAWAWSGKLLETAVFVVVAHRLGRTPWRRPTGSVGVWVGWMLAATAVATGAALLVGVETAPLPPGQVVLYQATMPGLAEELVFRGVLLGLLDDALGRPVAFGGVRWGAGAVITTALFWLGHSAAVGLDGTVDIAWWTVLDYGVFGALMCALRYRFDSVWPCIVSHNLHNLSLVLLATA